MYSSIRHIFSFCCSDKFVFCIVQINSIPTKPIEGQKTGTSGLRKKVALLFTLSVFLFSLVDFVMLSMVFIICIAL